MTKPEKACEATASITIQAICMRASSRRIHTLTHSVSMSCAVAVTSSTENDPVGLVAIEMWRIITPVNHVLISP